MKKIATSAPLIDVSSLLEREPPPTLVVPELISLMVHDSGSSTAYDNPRLSEMVIERLENIFHVLATHQHKDGDFQMCLKDVENWLVKINGLVGRGSEFRAAAREMGYEPPAEDEGDLISKPGGPKQKGSQRFKLPEDGTLSLQSFIQIYQEELTGGKFWGIAHDLHILGEPLPVTDTYTARFDRMYCSHAVAPIAVLDTLSSVACPNINEPSDHLPIAGMFQVK